MTKSLIKDNASLMKRLTSEVACTLEGTFGVVGNKPALLKEFVAAQCNHMRQSARPDSAEKAVTALSAFRMLAAPHSPPPE